MGDVAEELTAAELLQDRLTEFGLVRVLSRQDVSPEIVKELPLEEAARLVQQSFAPSPGRRAVKKVAKAKKSKKAMNARKNVGPPKLEVAPQPRYWLRVKRELHLLVCTNDQKYASIRHHLSTNGKTTQTFIASSITSAVLPYAGASAALIGPLVTIGLIALVRVGTNAWCAGQIE